MNIDDASWLRVYTLTSNDVNSALRVIKSLHVFFDGLKLKIFRSKAGRWRQDDVPAVTRKYFRRLLERAGIPPTYTSRGHYTIILTHSTTLSDLPLLNYQANDERQRYNVKNIALWLIKQELQELIPQLGSNGDFYDMPFTITRMQNPDETYNWSVTINYADLFYYTNQDVNMVIFINTIVNYLKKVKRLLELWQLRRRIVEMAQEDDEPVLSKAEMARRALQQLAERLREEGYAAAD